MLKEKSLDVILTNVGTFVFWIEINMAPPRVSKAFRAMRDIGISEDKTKPVLKKLLKLYDKNWELIEEENYRVLADAIFDEEDSKVHSTEPL